MTTPSRRPSARGDTHSPSPSVSTSHASRTSATERTTYSVEPKSDVLRSALEARRAKDAMATPSPADSRTTTPHQTTQSRMGSVTTASDPWLERAQSGEGTQPVPTGRPRRPSESGVRPHTQREQQAQHDALKNKMFGMGLQTELLKKQNHELKDQLDAANERIAELEPLEEENAELHEANNDLALTIQELEDERDQLAEVNEEMIKIAEESSAQMEALQTGVNEAGDLLFQAEQEQVALQEEVLKLKALLASKRSSTDEPQRYHGSLDGQARENNPSRIHSIDESRPSTSHIDSAYTSQSGSPPVKVQKITKGRSFADRAKDMNRLSLQTKQSMLDLNKRVSVASMKNRLPRIEFPPPDLPEMPEGYEDDRTQSRPEIRARRPRRSDKPLPTTPMNTTRATSLSHTPTSSNFKKGFKGMFKRVTGTGKTTIQRSASHQQSVSSQEPQYPESETPLPRRDSSRLDQPSSTERMRASSRETFATTDTAPTEYAESLPPPPSVYEQEISPRSAKPDSQTWWKDTQGIHSASGPTSGDGASRSTSVSRGTSVAGSRKGRAPTLFDGTETEEQFLEKAHAYRPQRR